MTLQQLVNKVLNDPAFFAALKKDPVKAFQGTGEKLTPDQIKALKEVNYNALEDVGAAFAGGSAIT